MQRTRRLRDLASLPRTPGPDHRGSLRGPALVLMFAAGTLANCACEEEADFTPAATYTPDRVLDFGNVAANSEKTQYISVLSAGRARLTILAANIQGANDAAKWRVSVAPELIEGLTPGRTSSIAVTYRPCPAAWETIATTDPVSGQPTSIDRLREGFDYDACTGGADSAELVTVEDGTRTGGATIVLSGQPVQPPVASVACQNGAPMCNADTPNISQCVAMVFGSVNSGDTPCDLVVEVQNKLREDKTVGELVIERVEISVRDLQTDELKTGSEVGFTLLDLDGSPLVIDPSSPLVVAAPGANSSCSNEPAGTCASRQFKIRFTGEAFGVWRGDATMDTGVRLYTSDPDQPVVKFNINGSGSAPDIECFPSQLNFGPVEQNSTKTATVACSNAGDSELVLSSIGFMTDTTGQRFTWDTDRGKTLPIRMPTNDRLNLYVSYTPRVAGQDSDTLLIGNNDAKTMNRVEIPISGGAVPRIRVDPSDTLVFASPEPPPAPPRLGTILVSNVGFGDLSLLRLEITGPSNDPTHPSADDFQIVECNNQNPCTRTDMLCPPSLATCAPAASQTQFTISYQNNDISTTDLAELHIRSNDPSDMEHTVVLSAQDMPCFFGTPVISVNTPRPCVGMPVEVSGELSQPGGTGSTTITQYDWSWFFTPAAAPTFAPNGTAAAVSSFTPTESGTYILGLDVLNDCGARSQAPATETINVSDTCN